MKALAIVLLALALGGCATYHARGAAYRHCQQVAPAPWNSNNTPSASPVAKKYFACMEAAGFPIPEYVPNDLPNVPVFLGHGVVLW